MTQLGLLSNLLEVRVLRVLCVLARAHTCVLHLANAVVDNSRRGEERPQGLQNRRWVCTETEECHYSLDTRDR